MLGYSNKLLGKNNDFHSVDLVYLIAAKICQQPKPLKICRQKLSYSANSENQSYPDGRIYR